MEGEDGRDSCSGSGTGSGSDIETIECHSLLHGTESDPDPDSDSDTDPNTNPDPDTGTDPNPDPNPESDPNPDPNPESDPNPDSDSPTASIRFFFTFSILLTLNIVPLYITILIILSILLMQFSLVSALSIEEELRNEFDCKRGGERGGERGGGEIQLEEDNSASFCLPNFFIIFKLRFVLF